MYDWKSRQTAKALYHEREIMNEDSFDLIYWKGIRYVMKARFNNSFATFYTKHVIGCCGVRHHLHNIDENVINVCPCCKEPDETTSHILLCKDEGQNYPLQEIGTRTHDLDGERRHIASDNGNGRQLSTSTECKKHGGNIQRPQNG